MSRRVLALILVGAGLISAAPARADRETLPADFPLSPVTWGGAGGGTSRAEAATLHRLPVIMVPGLGRDHRDWTGRHPGNRPPRETGSVYAAFLAAGYRPVELWMIDFAPEGKEMTSLEEATDDLKFFIASVLAYTGAPRVQILAHDTGALLTRLTLRKYHIAHWVEAEAYLAGPFHGADPAPDPLESLRGHPNAWILSPGSDLLREIVAFGESPLYRDPVSGGSFKLRTLTLRNGTMDGDSVFQRLPDSPALEGAVNVALPGLDHDALRCASAATAAFIPFLIRETTPLAPGMDRDGDGFRGAAAGGPDCDDSDPRVYPGAPEERGDGRDQDCNGHDLAPLGGRDGELPL